MLNTFFRDGILEFWNMLDRQSLYDQPLIENLGQ